MFNKIVSTLAKCFQDVIYLYYNEEKREENIDEYKLYILVIFLTTIDYKVNITMKLHIYM